MGKVAVMHATLQGATVSSSTPVKILVLYDSQTGNVSKIVAQRCDAINTAGSSIETGVVLGLDYTSLNATGVTLNEVTR